MCLRLRSGTVLFQLSGLFARCLSEVEGTINHYKLIISRYLKQFLTSFVCQTTGIHGMVAQKSVRAASIVMSIGKMRCMARILAVARRRRMRISICR